MAQDQAGKTIATPADSTSHYQPLYLLSCICVRSGHSGHVRPCQAMSGHGTACGPESGLSGHVRAFFRNREEWFPALWKCLPAEYSSGEPPLRPCMARCGPGGAVPAAGQGAHHEQYWLVIVPYGKSTCKLYDYSLHTALAPHSLLDNSGTLAI